MAETDDMIEGLRQAVRLSPENVPLRTHLGETLLTFGRPADAEKEFRAALQLKPDDTKLKFCLARAFEQQGKASAAIVARGDRQASGRTAPRPHPVLAAAPRGRS